MKTKWLLTCVLSIGLLLALAVSVGPGLAQGPESEGEASTEGKVGEAAVDAKIPIQGRLTSASGSPLHGTYTLWFRLYDVSSGGTALCEYNGSVSVVNGLFNAYMEGCSPWPIDGQQLWLGVEVGSDGEMTPRQPIYPVPYAWSLKPGAVISDTLDGILTARSADGIGVIGLQAGYFTGDLGMLAGRPSGFFGGRYGVIGISKESDGYGVAGWNRAASGANSIGVYGKTDSSEGWAGYFESPGNGVYISADSGKSGLNVASGLKSAVVRTADGSRLLYSEEATEVWFADYGFGELQNGLAIISIDPIFAQTVNLEEPYHVFIQVYGNAEVYVANRTSTQFQVHLRDGDPNVEFSYRIVAKRLEYEGQRLERAPWADNDSNLYPEKRAVWEAQQGPVEPTDSVSP